MNNSIENHGSLMLTKISLIIFNIGQVVHRVNNLIWCFQMTKFYLEDTSNAHNSTEGYTSDQHTAMVGLSIIVMSNVVMLGFFIICLVATIKEYRSTLITNGGILLILTFFNLFSSNFKLSLWMIYAVMSTLTFGYAFMISQSKTPSTYLF